MNKYLYRTLRRNEQENTKPLPLRLVFLTEGGSEEMGWHSLHWEADSRAAAAEAAEEWAVTP